MGRFLNQSKPQLIVIDAVGSGEYFVPHCPVCGNAAIDPEAGGYEPCSHLQFIYSMRLLDFEYANHFTSSTVTAKALRQSSEDCLTEDEGWGEWLCRTLGAAGFGSETLVFEVTNGGLAAGPVEETLAWGFEIP